MDGKRILLVDDDALVALFAQDVLHAAGYLVLGPATRLGMALKLAQEPVLDAAVLDVNLGGQPVWPVAQALVERNVPFLFVSGYGATLQPPPSCRHAPRIGKPFTAEALLGAVVQLLSGTAR